MTSKTVSKVKTNQVTEEPENQEIEESTETLVTILLRGISKE